MSEDTSQRPSFIDALTPLFERFSLVIQERFGINLTVAHVNMIVIGGIVVVVIAILSGFLYNIGEAPLLFGLTEYNNPELWDTMPKQYVIESFVIAAFLALGTIGMFLIRYTSRYSYEERMATILLIIGLLCLGGALLAMLAFMKPFPNTWADAQV